MTVETCARRRRRRLRVKMEPNVAVDEDHRTALSDAAACCLGQVSREMTASVCG